MTRLLTADEHEILQDALTWLAESYRNDEIEKSARAEDLAIFLENSAIIVTTEFIETEHAETKG